MNNFNFTLCFSDGSELKASPNTALIFLDETGDELLSDPIYPIFGFGGCCILVKDYNDIIHDLIPKNFVNRNVSHDMIKYKME
ncbi:MAG: hypothetical protein EOM54_04645 [Clostridia bacterium]|nr:hypothetical protein [Clostridia bacterium]